MYHLYSGRNVGWLTKTGTYSTALDDAAVFDREQALAMCKRHKDQGGYTLLPVRQEDLV